MKNAKNVAVIGIADHADVHDLYDNGDVHVVNSREASREYSERIPVTSIHLDDKFVVCPNHVLDQGNKNEIIGSRTDCGQQ